MSFDVIVLFFEFDCAISRVDNPQTIPLKYEGKVYKGHEAVEILIKNQLEGVEKAAANGMVVKVNSVLIPGLNDEHIVEIAKEVKKRGAFDKKIFLISTDD